MELREVRRARGELAGADVRLETKHGAADFAVGDRVQFTATDKRLRIHNGNGGTLTGIDERTGQVTAVLDAAHGGGREVTFSAAEFQGFRHGYAGTIYKGQGKTLDRTYLYHTEHWRSVASYVALTRQRESAQVFVARETARDAGQLARQMARGEVKAASITWATRDELTADRIRPPVEQPQAPGPEVGNGRAQPPAEKEYWHGLAAEGRRLAAQGHDAREARQRAAEPPADGTSRAALHRELLAMDRGALEAAASADLVGGVWSRQPMTVRDAARLVSPAYAAAADRAAELRKQAAEVERSIEHHEGVLRHSQEQGDTRWREMGFARQVMHKTGARQDQRLGLDERSGQTALENLAKLEPRRAVLAETLPTAEKAEAAAFARAEPEAAAELAKRRERGSLAREIRGERSREDVARQLQQERSQARYQGLGR